MLEKNWPTDVVVDNVVRILETARECGFTSVEIRANDFHLVASTSDDAVGEFNLERLGQSIEEEVPRISSKERSPESPSNEESTDDLGDEAVEDDLGVITVAAPTVGTFYRSPEPDEPPYVELGETVEEGATLGLVEAMKVFTRVTAGVAGRVRSVLVEDGDFVEYGQPLFSIEPLEPDAHLTRE